MNMVVAPLPQPAPKMVLVDGKLFNRPHIWSTRAGGVVVWLCGYPELGLVTAGAGPNPAAAFDAWKNAMNGRPAKNLWAKL